MKTIRRFHPVHLLPLALLASAALADTKSQPGQALASALPATTERVEVTERPRQPRGFFRDLPLLLTPVGLVTIVREEIRDEVRGFKQDLRDLSQGEPEALLKAAFTGARIAGADAGALTAARLSFQIIAHDPQSTLGEELPDKLAQAPDHTARHVLRSALRSGRSGDVRETVWGGLRGQALDLVPATLHSVRLFLTSPLKADLPAKEQS